MWECVNVGVVIIGFKGSMFKGLNVLRFVGGFSTFQPINLYFKRSEPFQLL